MGRALKHWWEPDFRIPNLLVSNIADWVHCDHICRMRSAADNPHFKFNRQCCIVAHNLQRVLSNVNTTYAHTYAIHNNRAANHLHHPQFSIQYVVCSAIVKRKLFRDWSNVSSSHLCQNIRHSPISTDKPHCIWLQLRERKQRDTWVDCAR